MVYGSHHLGGYIDLNYFNFAMILAALIFTLLIGGLFAGLLERRFKGIAKWISLLALLINMVLLILIWLIIRKVKFAYYMNVVKIIRMRLSFFLP